MVRHNGNQGDWRIRQYVDAVNITSKNRLLEQEERNLFALEIDSERLRQESGDALGQETLQPEISDRQTENAPSGGKIHVAPVTKAPAVDPAGTARFQKAIQKS
jgi:hypothetical protein